jgi:uncharacterized OB-fold protein
MSGEEGVVYSTTTVYARDGAYNVCLVDLADGSRVMSTVAGIAPEDVRIGMAVRARAQTGADAIVFDVA